MKTRLTVFSLLVFCHAGLAQESSPVPAGEKAAEQASVEPQATEDPVVRHRDGSSKVADRQDELSADVQQLAAEQTVPKVIELLRQVESMMDEATDQLAAFETGGNTIAAQTEVIEKIHEAAKEKQKQSGSSSGSAMMDMMERMMDKSPDGDQQQKDKNGQKPGEKGGKGMTGDSDAGNTADGGLASGKSENRRVPKAAGNTGHALPEEFQKALDAYNRGAEKKTK